MSKDVGTIEPVERPRVPNKPSLFSLLGRALPYRWRQYCQCYSMFFLMPVVVTAVLGAIGFSAVGLISGQPSIT